jgi:hypothetical protein
MPDDPKRLTDLIGSVADGNAPDWDQVAHSTADEDVRALLRELRTVAGVAQIHRSQVGDQAVTDEGTTTIASLRQWGRFLLVRKIGEGSFGEVYHARDGLLDHDVALKLLRPHLTDHSRILHEARTLVRVRHQNVVSLYGADIHDNRVGFWMELIEGHTLADVVAREGVRSASEAAVIGQDLCRAMAAVHAQHLVHRDIKAKNVMRASGGRVVLMDFGAGEVMKGPRAFPQRLAGTPLYLAPELFEGAPASVQSDVYALGVLLYFLVTGSFPVQGTELDDLIQAHASGQRRHLGDLRPDLPDAFVKVVETMTDPDPARRYATAGAARAGLEGVVVGPTVVPDRPSSRPTTGARRVGRAAAVMLAATATIAVAGFVSTAAFDLTFGRTGGFGAETPLDWLVWGLRSLVAPVTYMTISAVLLSLVVAIGRVVCRIVPPCRSFAIRTGQRLVAFARGHELTDPNLLMQIVAAAGACGVASLAWTYWDEVTAFAIYIDDAPASDLARLQPANEPRFDAYARLLEQLLLLYGIALFSVYRITRRTRGALHPLVRAAALAVPLVSLFLLRELPYRIVYQNRFERVDLADERCYEIGSRPGELLLHCPEAAPPRNRVVPVTDSRVRARGVVESVFTPAGQSAVAN